MGWNSWNCWGCAVDQGKIKAAADAMIKSGLAAHGFQYINIDDCWEAGRNDKGEILTNEKFPEMKDLGDYIHGKGLRFGIYSSPGPKTCAGFEASYQHEEQDAKDLGELGRGLHQVRLVLLRRHRQGRQPGRTAETLSGHARSLDKCERDIVFSLCQYGMGDVWKWGWPGWRQPVAHDRRHRRYLEVDGRNRFRPQRPQPAREARPVERPDMLVVGKVAGAPSLHPSRLTRNEQITHITLWSLLAAPLLIGCDMSALDEFTVDVLGNDEVLDVDQDMLGKAAVRVAQEGTTEVWARPLSDGTVAVGLFNRGRTAAKVTVKWSDLKLRRQAAGARSVAEERCRRFRGRLLPTGGRPRSGPGEDRQATRVTYDVSRADAGTTCSATPRK